MYRLFVYGYNLETKFIYITDEYEYNTFEEALKRVVFFEDDDLFEIAKDVPFGLCGDRYLATVARPASMRAFVNSYYSRW